MNRLFLLFIVGTIFSFGLVMIFSTSSADVLDHDLIKSPHHALVKQILFAVIGIALGWLAYRAGYQVVLEMAPLILFCLTLLLLLTLIPGVGKVVNGSRRWIGVGAFTFQPSEFVKVFLPLFFISRLSLIDKKKFKQFFIQVLLCIPPIFLVLLEPNNGTVAVMGLTLAAVAFLEKISWKFWALPLLICMGIGILFATQLPYVSARIKVYLNPELDIQGKGHQPHQAKIAAGSGRLLGKGPGNGWQKLSYLPEAQNDYIAAIFGEEFGFLGIMLLIFAYMALCLGGMAIALKSPSQDGALVAGILSFLISIQAFLNMGVVSGLLPTTGLNLPFFSQGGTSLIANCIALGLLLSVAEIRVMARSDL